MEKKFTAKFLETLRYVEDRSSGGALKPNRYTDPSLRADYGGLYLTVLPTEARCWRFDYRHPVTGKNRTISYGQLPDVTLSKAKEKHAQARQQLYAEKKDPLEVREEERAEREAKANNTFRAVAEDWYKDSAKERSETWKSSRRAWLDNDVFPAIGDKPIDTVGAKDIRKLLEKMIRERGVANSAATVRAMIAEIFDHAIAGEVLREGFNPAVSIRKKIKKLVPKTVNHPKLDKSELPEFMRKIDGYQGLTKGAAQTQTVRLGLKLLVHTLVRKMELVGARWAEVNLDAAEWVIPAPRMKNRQPHTVPLSSQAVEMFRELKAITGRSEFCFPSHYSNKKPLSKFTLNYALERLGYAGKVGPHGLRATGATTLSECGYDSELIDLQLSHLKKNKVSASYNRDPKLQARRLMLQFWSDYLVGAAKGADVIPIRGAA
jgi:integrase